MEKFWKWLMKMDARGIFVVAVVLLLAAGTWSAYTIVHADDVVAETAVPSRPSVPLQFNEYQPIGVIGFISNQFAAETLVLPINPFHPTFESIVRTYVSKGGSDPLTVYGRQGQVVAPKKHAGKKSADAGEGLSGNPHFRDGEAIMPIDAVQPQRSGDLVALPEPTISFKGMMQRPDGQFAAYLLDSEEGAFFVVVGDKVRNAKVVSSGKDGVELEFPNGLRVALGLGDPPWVVGAEGRE